MPKFIYPDWLLSLVFGLGLVLFCCHSESLILHDSDGKAAIFLPQWGFLLMFGVMAVLYFNKRLTIGRKLIWIPLALITFFIAVNPLFTDSTVYQAVFGVMLFAMYTAGRTLGKQIFYVFVPFLIVEALSTVITGSSLNDANGGILSRSNYAGGAGFLMLAGILACLAMPVKFRWLMVLTVLIGAVFTGSPAVMIAMAFLAVAVVWKRDYSISLASVVVVVVLALMASYALNIHERTEQVIRDGLGMDIVTTENDTGWGNGRLPAYKTAVSSISFFGHGYALFETERTITPEGDETWTVPTVHNVPLIIVDQIGIIPAIMWLFITLYCLVRTSWKYAFVCVLGLCVFDHFIWTIFAPFWWVLVGVATTGEIEDKIFKVVKRETETNYDSWHSEGDMDTYGCIY